MIQINMKSIRSNQINDQIRILIKDIQILSLFFVTWEAKKKNNDKIKPPNI